MQLKKVLVKGQGMAQKIANIVHRYVKHSIRMPMHFKFPENLNFPFGACPYSPDYTVFLGE